MSMLAQLLPLFALVALSIPAHAADSIPRTKILFSGDTQISLRYSTLEESFVPPGASYSNISLKSSPLFVTVQNGWLGARDHVHFMLIQYQEACLKGICHYAQAIEEGDLRFARAGQFEGSSAFPLTLYSRIDNGPEQRVFRSARQEIVIWINGQIFKDTCSLPNLYFVLRWYSTYTLFFFRALTAFS